MNFIYKSKILLITGIILLFIPLASYPEPLGIDDAVKKGLSNHESIKASRYLEQMSKSDLKKAKSDRWFKVSTSYRALRRDDYQVSVINGADAVVGGEKFYTWNVTLTQPVFTGFALQSAQKIAEANLSKAKINTKATNLDLACRIKKAYNNLYLAEKMLLVAEQTLESLKAHKSDAEKFYKNGLVPYNDLLKAEVKMAEAVQNKALAITSLKNARAYFNIQIGRGTSFDTKISPLKKPVVVPSGFGYLADDALSRRPELQSIKKTIEILGLSKTIEKSAYYPQVSLFADYTQNGGEYNEAEDKYSNSSVGIQLRWTFFDSLTTKNLVDSKTNQIRSVRENLRELKKNISLEIETSLRNLKVAGINIETAEKSVTQAKENWRITNIQYKKQTTTSTEVLNARTYLTAAEAGYYRALYQYWTAMAEYKKATGHIF